MKAVLIEAPGDESVMFVGKASEPELVPGSVRIRVSAAGVNRADLMQRQGMYPPPAGASEILGLECAGEILEVASDVPSSGSSSWKPGDRVMALLAGGGYSEQVVVDCGSTDGTAEANSDWNQQPAVLVFVGIADRPGESAKYSTYQRTNKAADRGSLAHPRLLPSTHLKFR